MQIMLKKINDLVPAGYNPRKDLQPGDPEYEKLKRSIETFGYVEPIIWNQQTGHIVGGHQRLKVLKDLGFEEINTVVVDLDEDQEKALNVALNKISGAWDEEKLMTLMSDLESVAFDLTLTGFDIPELDELFRGTMEEDIKEDDFDVEAALKEPTFSKQGDLWFLGKHRLFVGDATQTASYHRLVGQDKVNLVVTDPPYNVNYEGAAGKIQNDHMEQSTFYQFLVDAFQAMSDVMDDEASIYVFHADTEGLNFRRAFHEAGFYLSGTCIWKKNSLVLGRSPYQWQHEPILFGWKKKGKHRWYAGRKETTVWEYDRPTRNDSHPTMKPIPLISYPIMNSSMSNAIVLDPFGGSGSTLMACQQTDRICYTMELDEKFADVIVNRYIELVDEDSEVKVERDGVEFSYKEIVAMKVE